MENTMMSGKGWGLDLMDRVQNEGVVHHEVVVAVPARRHLLAAMEPARADAEGLVLAGGPVRHAAAAPRQGRRPRRRDENEDQGPPADQRPINRSSASSSA